jgi:NAD(P)-dependent dehydrogenase (short-subunit alcohol dehydrogenase family)
VAHWEEIEPFAEEAWNHFGKVDILVNNAGMSPLYDDLRDVTEDYWEKVVGVNLKGPFKMTVEFGSRMFEADGGSIINLSTLASLNPSWNTIPYGAAKAGLNIMAKGFIDAWGRKVRVNTIIPGAFRTDVTRFWASIPEGIGEPEEMVGAVLYLASDAASYTTGAELRVAGR